MQSRMRKGSFTSNFLAETLVNGPIYTSNLLGVTRALILKNYCLLLSLVRDLFYHLI